MSARYLECQSLGKLCLVRAGKLAIPSWWSATWAIQLDSVATGGLPGSLMVACLFLCWVCLVSGLRRALCWSPAPAPGVPLCFWPSPYTAHPHHGIGFQWSNVWTLGVLLGGGLAPSCPSRSYLSAWEGFLLDQLMFFSTRERGTASLRPRVSCREGWGLWPRQVLVSRLRRRLQSPEDSYEGDWEQCGWGDSSQGRRWKSQDAVLCWRKFLSMGVVDPSEAIGARLKYG